MFSNLASRLASPSIGAARITAGRNALPSMRHFSFGDDSKDSKDSKDDKSKSADSKSPRLKLDPEEPCTNPLHNQDPPKLDAKSFAELADAGQLKDDGDKITCEAAEKPPAKDDEKPACGGAEKPPPKDDADEKTPCGGAAAKPKDEGCPVPDVCGLSERVVLPREQPLGPGACSDGAYKVPEYYSYDRSSYAEAFVEMDCYRLPQPSALKRPRGEATTECKKAAAKKAEAEEGKEEKKEEK